MKNREINYNRQPTGEVGVIGEKCLKYLGKYIKYKKDEYTTIYALIQDLEEDYEEYLVPLDSEEVIEVIINYDDDTDLIELLKPNQNGDKHIVVVWVDEFNINEISEISEEEYLKLRNYITE